MRWILQGTWSGYRSSQSHVCHRTVLTNKKAAERYAKISAVVFTDGTTMSIEVRPCLVREKVQVIHGYDSLLADFAYRDMEGYCSVASLIQKRGAAPEVSR